MQTIESIEALEAHYGKVSPPALSKVCDHIIALYQRWIKASRFMILSTVGPDGTDASPRGDNDKVVRIVDARTRWLPDWKGNNRLDSLKNIVEDGRLSLMFMVPGPDTVARINGEAIVTADDDITGAFERDGKLPCTVTVITVREVYFQCAKALMRSGFWQIGGASTKIPIAGEFLQEHAPEFAAASCDEGYPQCAKGRLW
ncbi:MAG: pyridoxamine 5'-phosphate oxidase [Gammaproteobacteria bacterium]|nr:pyridoxamine 5'-phosphate oxidase [Gammaproteobacteria bacterium]